MRLLLFSFAFALLAMCSALAQAPTADPSFGAYPSDYEKIVKNYFSQSLTDPYSVVYQRIDPPVENTSGNGTKSYKVCVVLNAKNRMGGYVGYTAYAVYIRDGKVMTAFETTPEGLNLCPTS